MTKKKKILIPVISILVVILVLVVLRFMLCPEQKAVEYRKVTIPEKTMVDIGSRIEEMRLDIQQLPERLNGRRVLLIGEEHMKKEIIDYFLLLLDNLPDDRLVLNLEWPEAVQGFIDSYMESGEETYLEKISNSPYTLPYQAILRWAFKNKDRVAKVYAMDENTGRIRFNRKVLCTDTRNKTMAKKIYQTYNDFPGARIIAYGGMMHMLKSGRYRYDEDSRTPAGNLVVTRMGIPKEDVRIIMINGEGKFPLSPAWKGTPGALEMTGGFASLPFDYFFEYPIFRVRTADELFHFFINVGTLSPIETGRR